jgi:hypothetical protein
MFPLGTCLAAERSEWLKAGGIVATCVQYVNAATRRKMLFSRPPALRPLAPLDWLRDARRGMLRWFRIQFSQRPIRIGVSQD